ncbi:zinc finger protein 2-like isoform X2 [Protopterus annectens]|uniref:zinc finger protein 2-like isoform X2 n=1 Tax=Protopterus annectens TaxID=7888 RepID=UPI001CFA7D1C|nr:zinc finger protein 2-like isoform X2 [Protopterus annectens]
MNLEVPDAFEDVVVTFTDEEWRILSEQQKELHREMMVQNYETMISVGYDIPLEHLLSLIWRNDEPTTFHLKGEKSEQDKECFEDTSCFSESADYDETQYPPLPPYQQRLPTTVSCQTVVCKKNITDQMTYTGHKLMNYLGDGFLYCKQCGKCFCFKWKDKLLSHLCVYREEKRSKYMDYGMIYTHKPTDALQQQTCIGKHLKNANNWLSFPDKPDCSQHTGSNPFQGNDHGLISQEKQEVAPFQWDHQSEKISRNAFSSQKVEVGEKPLKCANCRKGFSVISGLSVHQGRCLEAEHFKCSECRETFTNKAHLDRNQSIMGKTDFICKLCGKAFKLSQSLVNHLKAHKQVKSHKCANCGKNFRRPSELEVHWLVHTQDSPFKCSDCEKGFTTKSHLSKHQKVHTDMLNFICSDCGKCFKSFSVLSAHKKVHAKEKEIRRLLSGRVIDLNWAELEDHWKAELAVHHKVQTGKKQIS